MIYLVLIVGFSNNYCYNIVSNLTYDNWSILHIIFNNWQFKNAEQHILDDNLKLVNFERDSLNRNGKYFENNKVFYFTCMLIIYVCL